MNPANILVFDVGSTYTKVVGFVVAHDAKGETLSYAGRAQSPTSIHDIEEGLNVAMDALANSGVPLDTTPLIFSSCSAAGGLRMVAMGYMPRVTVKASKEVAMNAGARVLEVLSCFETAEYREEVLCEIRPDIILLTGGTDGGDTDAVIDNARVVIRAVQSMREYQTSTSWAPVVIVAGNLQSQGEASSLLRDADIKISRVPNILPTIHELRVKPAREAIHEQFIRQITKAPGLAKLIDKGVEGKVAPTPGAVLLATELLAKGTHISNGVGSLMVVDLGGATTDIHSVIPELEALSIEERGLIVSNEKQGSYRTVEGNLGMRVSACGIIETLGPRAVLQCGDPEEFRHFLGYTPAEDLTPAQWEELEEQITRHAERMEAAPDTVIPESSELASAFDTAMGTAAVAVAIRRHAGKISEGNAVLGICAGMPIGRDTRFIQNIIAVGGIFTHSSEKRSLGILRRAFAKPLPYMLPMVPTFILDKEYLLFSLGLLAQKYPEATLAFGSKRFAIEPVESTAVTPPEYVDNCPIGGNCYKCTEAKCLAKS